MQKQYDSLKLIKVENLGDFVYKVSLNRPSKFNALNMEIWKEIGDCFQWIDEDSDCRVVILQGEGKHFCSGLDLGGVSFLNEDDGDKDSARKGRAILKTIKFMQKQFTYIDECSKPVIVAMHGYCLGAAIDISTACDVRVSTKDAILSVKEVDIGMAADVGTLNRLPKVVGNHSWIKDICLTARHFSAGEALQFGLLSRVFDTREEMINEVQKMAKLIASKSPVGVQGTKNVLNYARDHTIENSLNYVATWNMSQLFTDDLIKASMASFSKQPQPPFSKL
uniref:Delta(3,5)-Delta(2,4)-dienoyl-CoA isomerase, mitochondrial n=1 Tax=Caenorhabditis tropicalis TaxID=1561998 RepID=A0A1I7U8M4_9PELO